MKILQVTKGLYPYSIGGIGVVVDNLSQNLINSGMNVEVLTLDLVGQFEHDKTYKVHNLKSNFVIYGNPISISLPLWLLNRRNRYDVIHAHSHLYFSTFICALVRRIGSSPLVITNHGLYSQTAPIKVSKIWLKTFGMFIYASADKIICLSEHDKEVLVNLKIDKSKIIVIPNWIDLTKFCQNSDRTIENRVLSVGRLVEGKGMHFLIDSFKDVIKAVPSAKLIIIGSGPQENKLKQMVDDYSLNDVIEFKKDLREGQLIEEYQKCSLFVLPSFSEGFPLTVLEAMACGKPVIATADIQDIVCDAGLIVPYGSSKELGAAILRLLENEKNLNELTKKCRKYAEEKYSWIKVRQIIMDIYNELNRIHVP